MAPRAMKMSYWSKSIVASTIMFVCVVAYIAVPTAQQAPGRNPQPTAATQPSSPVSNPGDAAFARATLDKYCVGCHNGRAKAGDLTLDNQDVGRVAGTPELWEKVVRKLRDGAMPPPSSPRPDRAGYDRLAGYFEHKLDSASPNAGRPVARRLNRVEYTNAIHDLLDLEVDGAALLPTDESGYGFDNIGDVLSVSPGLL